MIRLPTYDSSHHNIMLDKKELLAASPFFKGIPEHLLQQLADITKEKPFTRNASIFFEGDEAIGFYMVGQGRAKIFQMALDGREQILHIFGPGEPIVAVQVLQVMAFALNAVCMEDSLMLFFPRQEFIDLITSSPSMALSMLAVLSMRLRQFANQIESLSLKEVPGRLAAHLLYLAEEQGRTDQVVLDIPKGQLANLLGTSPETLSRIFAKMAKEGIINVQGKTIQLLRYEDLVERA